jgi:acyl dehydratase
MTTTTDRPSAFDDALAEARKMIGQELRIEQYNHEATYDAIRHYAFGIGDDNPLWCDGSYAAAGPFGTMVGPPTFFLSVFAPTLNPGLPGWQGFHAGGDYRWNRLARRGEQLTARSRLTDVAERSGRTVDRFLIQIGETSYTNQDGEELAVFTTRHFRMPSKRETGKGAYEPRPPRQYTNEELQAIARDVFAEEVRGARPRFWEDVHEGDQLQPVVKGPLDRVSMICYYAGAMPGVAYRPVDLSWRQRQRAIEHPELAPTNFNPPTDLFELVRGGSGHHDPDRAHDAGMPGQYDNGHMRIGWTTHLVTNWMGDTGKLKRLHTEMRRPNVIGNTTWFRGTVTATTIDDDGDPVTEISIEGQDQDGTVNTKATASVVLPRKTSNA